MGDYGIVNQSNCIFFLLILANFNKLLKFRKNLTIFVDSFNFLMYF